MSARELKVRIVHALNQKGWTFEQEKVEEIQQQNQQQKNQQKHVDFLARAREAWSKKSA